MNNDIPGKIPGKIARDIAGNIPSNIVDVNTSTVRLNYFGIINGGVDCYIDSCVDCNFDWQRNSLQLKLLAGTIHSVNVKSSTFAL